MERRKTHIDTWWSEGPTVTSSRPFSYYVSLFACSVLGFSAEAKRLVRQFLGFKTIVFIYLFIFSLFLGKGASLSDNLQPPSVRSLVFITFNQLLLNFIFSAGLFLPFLKKMFFTLMQLLVFHE